MAVNYYPYNTTAYPNWNTTNNQTVPQQNLAPSLNGYPAINVVWINDEKDATYYAVGPNSAVVLWDYANGKIFLKQADAAGKPTIKTYSLTEEVPKEPEIIKTDNFVSTESFTDLKKTIDILKKEIDSMKTDMYGIAGKKKSKTKSED